MRSTLPSGIRQAMARKDCTVFDIAEAGGVSVPTARKILKGEEPKRGSRLLRSEAAQRIAQFLGISLKKLGQ